MALKLRLARHGAKKRPYYRPLKKPLKPPKLKLLPLLLPKKRLPLKSQKPKSSFA